MRRQSDICCDFREYGTFTIIDPAVACPREGKTDICDMKSRDTVARIRKMYRGLQEGRTACHNAVTEQRGNYRHTLHLWGTSHYFSRFVSVLFGRYFIWKGRGCRMYLFRVCFLGRHSPVLYGHRYSTHGILNPNTRLCACRWDRLGALFFMALITSPTSMLLL